MKLRIFVGTKRGLFHYTTDERRARWAASAPSLEGREVYFVGRDARDGAIWAATQHKVWGAHIHRSEDHGETWRVMEAAPHYEDERALRAVWCVAPGHPTDTQRLLAGIEPAGLFASEDGGVSWASVDSLNQHETAKSWQAAGGALALHSIAVDPRDPHRIICAVSAGGFYKSGDGGKTWRALNRGVRAEFLPQKYPPVGQCVHRVIMHPADPDRLYQQNHCGTYRSDDAGESWIEITNNLPSDYGYALAVDPNDRNTAFVIPEESSHMRATVAGRLRVYRTTDAGGSWQALQRGLPQENAYLSVLREGLSSDPLVPCGVYFGTSGGHLFGSVNRGESWTLIAGFLPRIVCVSAAVIDPGQPPPENPHAR
jgi:photosystem II stability/assembly factor-like uncharacterized protein